VLADPLVTLPVSLVLRGRRCSPTRPLVTLPVSLVLRGRRCSPTRS
jgi:hypothetical protein